MDSQIDREMQRIGYMIECTDRQTENRMTDK